MLASHAHLHIKQCSFKGRSLLQDTSEQAKQVNTKTGRGLLQVVKAVLDGLGKDPAIMAATRNPTGQAEAKLEQQPRRTSKSGESPGNTAMIKGSQRPKWSKDSLLKALEERNWKAAYQELQQLVEDDIQQLEGRARHNDVIILIAKGGSLTATLEAYRRLAKSRLSYSALANILATCIKNEDVVQAVEVFRDMHIRGMTPNITTWCFLINALGKKSRRKGWPYAKNAYSLWKELEEEPSVQADIDASFYATGIMACTRHGEMDEAEGLLATMIASGHVPDVRVLNMLIKGYSGTGNFESMQRVVERMADLDVSANASTYNTMIDAYASRGMMQKAHSALEDATKHGIKPDVWAYSSLIKGYVKARDMRQVDAVLDQMKEAKVQPNVVTMTNLLDGCVKAGLISEAESLMQSMREANLRPNIRSYNSLLYGHAANGDTTAVREVLLQMSKEGIAPREDTYNSLMAAALASGNMKLVPELFEKLLNMSLTPSSLSYTSLITALGRMRDSAEATGVFRRLKERIGVDRIALNALISALANGNQMEEAEAQLQRAANLAYKQGQPPPIEAYGAMVKAYTQRRDANAAIDCFNEFQDRGGKPDDTILDMVVTACVRAGEFKRALQFVRSMEREGKNLNKARLKQTLEVVMRLQEKAARQKKKSVTRNDNLERFKFWLGLPNSYYNENGEPEQQ